jgi:phytoene synthase
LTNILRDVREDQRERPRLHPVRKIFANSGPTLATHDERFVRLMSFEAQRARAYYDESRPLIALVHPRSRPSLWALIEIYRRLLARIERSNFDVLEKRIRVPTWEKLSILASAALRT